MAAIRPQEFVSKWRSVTLKERAAVQEHFLDLCALIGHPTPAQADPTGERFTFEAGTAKLGGGQGFADVWKRGFFAWEYKGKHANLDNERPTWLDLAHKKLDAAVAAAYGWPEDLADLDDEEILARLLALNLARAGAG